MVDAGKPDERDVSIAGGIVVHVHCDDDDDAFQGVKNPP